MTREVWLYNAKFAEFCGLPSWVKWLMRVGRFHFEKAKNSPETQFVTVISMPRASYTAGLVALGAEVAELSLTKPLTKEQYFLDILERARNNLESGTSTILNNIDGKEWIVESIDDNSQIRVLDAKAKNRKKRQKKYGAEASDNGVCTRYVIEYAAFDWWFSGEPKICGDEIEIDPLPFHAFWPNYPINEENLKYSSSKIMIVARGASSDSSFRRRLRIPKFSIEGKELSLENLLMLETDHNRVSRVQVSSPDQLPRTAPSLVVSEGTISAIRSLDNFRSSNHIAIINRDAPLESLESFAIHLQEKSRYYSQLDLGDLASPSKLIASRTMRKSI